MDRIMIPTDKEVEEWYEENIDIFCSASSAIYKFRQWLEEYKLLNNNSNGWISVEKDLPPVSTFVDGYNEKWIDEDYNPEGIRQCFLEDSAVWISSDWNNELDQWITDDKSTPSHWKQRNFKPIQQPIKP